MITAGIDVGSSVIKSVIVRHEPDGPVIAAEHTDRLRHRDVIAVARDSFENALAASGVDGGEIAYVATTGEGEMIEFRTGHFYGMTAHARGGHELVPDATAVLDIGALHARAMVIDGAGRVVRYRMTSQCASGSGQFIENIGRYLGVTLEEIGSLSQQADKPEKCSSICAVLAETDVINMVSRGIPIPNILKGIHLSMAGRFVRLLEASEASGTVVVTGGLSADGGLLAALREESARSKAHLEFATHPQGILAGALGAAVWARHRLEKLRAGGLDLKAVAAGSAA